MTILEFPIFWILLIIAILFWAVIPIWRGGALWVPTYPKVVKKMLELAKVKKGDLVIDLGSGDGRIPIEAARVYGARGLGIEINFFLVWWSRIRARFRGVKGVSFKWQDLWHADVSEADIITLYLFGRTTPQVGEMLLSKTKPNVTVVSHLWKMGPGWEMVDSDAKDGVWVYKKAKK